MPREGSEVRNNAQEKGIIASVVFAAGKGSRMTGYEGNKTLLPLIPKASSYEGERPFLREVIENLPSGPKGIVVHHRAEDVLKATEDLGVTYLFQPTTNGTGGALLAARPFLESVSADRVIITMGDVPLISPETYQELVRQLDAQDFVILVFEPRDKAQYGLLEMENDRVLRIVEWKYWHTFAPERQAALRYCNAGVYAARHTVLLNYLDRLAKRPHHVQKQRNGQWITIEEYFLTDLVELMNEDHRSIGIVAAKEEEVMGVDTPEVLDRVQKQYGRKGP